MRVARVMGAVAVVALAVTVGVAAPWWVRGGVVFATTLVAAIGFFEARASVCIVGAAQGVFEDDGRHKTPMEATLLPAIRRVAGTIIGKSMLIGVAAGAVAALTSLVY